MATHAHSTRTPLLPPSGSPQPLLGTGLGRQPGPVTEALRAMRAADPADHAIAAIRDGLASYFADADRQRFRELRRAIADRIEADLALLDGLDGDADLEPSLGSIDATAYNSFMDQERWSIGGGQDREAGDDNGIADYDAIGEQGFPGYGAAQ